MQVGMNGQRLAPGVQNGREADLGAEMLGVAGNSFERLGHCLEQKAVDDLLVLVGDDSNLLRQGEDHMKALDRQQIGLARFQPSTRGRALAGRAMPVTTAGIGYLFMPARLALQDMTSQRRRTARLDGGHHAALAAIEMAGIGLAIRFTVAAEDIRHLEGRTPHARRLSPTASTPTAAASPAP